MIPAVIPLAASRAWIIPAICLSAGLASGWWARGIIADADRADRAEAASNAQASASRNQVRWIDNRLEAADAAKAERAALESDVAAARTELGRLRQQIARRDRMPQTTAAAERDAGARAREALGECAARLEAVAGELEQRRSEVRELSAAWPK